MLVNLKTGLGLRLDLQLRGDITVFGDMNIFYGLVWEIRLCQKFEVQCFECG